MSKKGYLNLWVKNKKEKKCSGGFVFKRMERMGTSLKPQDPGALITPGFSPFMYSSGSKTIFWKWDKKQRAGSAHNPRTSRTYTTRTGPTLNRATLLWDWYHLFQKKPRNLQLNNLPLFPRIVPYTIRGAVISWVDYNLLLGALYHGLN